MLDHAALRRDLQFLDAIAADGSLEPLRRELPLPLKPGLLIVDLDRLLASLRADCSAALAAPQGSCPPVLIAAAEVCHDLVTALRDLLEARDSEAAAREALAELEAA